ncbi:hypothetical protein L6R53_02330 [Myxococcota bacterium]|nr:hypothetical protein [Myxococcota bacterium]
MQDLLAQDPSLPANHPSPDTLRALLQAHGLRITAPRLAVREACRPQTAPRAAPQRPSARGPCRSTG